VLALTEQIAAAPLIDDLDLVSRAQSGDAAAFSELCERHAGALLRQATVLSRDPAAGEDLVQETLLAAWKSIGRFHGGCRFFTWLCSILLHRHRTLLRRQRPIPFSILWFKERTAAETTLADVIDTAQWPSESVQDRERAAALMRCLQELPPRQQQVLHLRFYAQESLQGIAAALGCSVGTVKSRLFHGLEKLRKMKALEP
jgi:RNA polymerase sigma-70 factor (ECF subfamily)